MYRSTWKVIVAGLVASSLIWTAPAFAQDAGFYVGGAVGQSKLKDSCSGVTIPCDDKDIGWKIFGGYQVNKNFSTEIGYTDLGEATVSGTFGAINFSQSAQVKAWEFLGVGTLPLADRLSAYGKLGFFRWNLTFAGQAAIPGFTPLFFSSTDTGTDLTFGLGLKYDVTKNIGTRLEWQRYRDIGTDTAGKTDVDLISLGVVFKF